MDVSIKDFEAMTVASVRHTGPYAQCKVAWETLCNNSEVCKTFGPHSEFLGLCHDDPETTEEDRIRYDACVTIAEPAEFGDKVVVQAIPAGRYAVCTHKGSYEGLQEVYHRLYHEWLPGSGHKPAEGPALEVYLNNPEHTPPEELLTEIRILLES